MIKKLLFLSVTALCWSLNAQQSYYNDVDLTKSGIALKDALATKIASTHTRNLSYTPGVWEACKATDLNPSNSSQVLLVYGYSSSGTTARTRGVNDNGGNSGDWNREHVYPKSLGTPNLGSSGPGADAHHLRPSDVSYNSQRGNKKFATGSGNSGNVTGGWYPGDEWKGDVARMMMYMYLRYGNQCLPKNVAIGTANTVDSNMIDLLLKWNAEDPVSNIEDARNTYHGNSSNTYAQGNRNPFIDNPNLATQIWGGPVAENRWATASTKDHKLSSVEVYPNPSAIKKIFVKIPASVTVSNITLYSVLGKKVLSVTPAFGQETLTLDNLAKGIYLLTLSNQQASTTKKIVIL
ncbi:Extracellular ribonuclease (modular protein) [Tenacibaculum litopenaei]|jgi:endonuclease I|uniref:endonuclease n=1 Tax=Tenacibaculum litopenaei TaxID=396016 RepID=UPI0038955827